MVNNSTAAQTASVPPDLTVMGYISGSFGIQGWVNIVADTEHAGSLFDYKTWWLGRDGKWTAYTLLEGGVHTKKLAAHLKGVVGRDAAAALRGCEVAVPRSAMPPSHEGEYYWVDLIGLDVVNTQAERLGVVERLFETGANDVLVVKDGDTERLLPFVGPVVLKVDLAARLITVEWGLDY